MADRILVVTGARALSDTPAAEAWARDKLRAALDWWEPALLVHGGCAGSPDEWASDLVGPTCSGCGMLVYYAGGGREEHRVDGAYLSGSWLLAGDIASPLLRNRRMMQGARLRQDTGDEVLVVGLTAPWARTHGTEHALGRAEDYGLRLARRACPATLGPVPRD